MQGTRGASTHTFGAVCTTTLAMHLVSQQADSDIAASPFPRLCISLSRLLQIIKRDWKSEGIREAKAPRRNGEDRSATLKHTPFAHRLDTHTRCVRLSMRLCTNMTASARRSKITSFAHPNDTQLLEEIQEAGRMML